MISFQRCGHFVFSISVNSPESEIEYCSLTTIQYILLRILESLIIRMPLSISVICMCGISTGLA